MNDEIVYDELDEEAQAILKACWEAETEKAVAEAEKARAEAVKARAEAQTAEADALTSQLQAEEQQLTLDDLRKDRREEEATDNENLTYVFSSDVGSTSVKTCMMKLSQWHRLHPGQKITIILNSPGGDIIEGMALFDHIVWLRQEGHQVDIVVRGMAASMGGILLQSGSKRVVGKEAWVLIHRAAFLALGKTFQVEDEVKWVKRIEDRIIDIFVERAKEAEANGTCDKGVSKAMIKRNWDRKDWWLTSDECLKLGIVDEVG